MLQEELECSYECSSMLLGILTRELRKQDIPIPCSVQPFHRLSIEGTKHMIEGLRQPSWYGTSGMYARHHCNIQQKLSPALEEAEKELPVFNLHDFQIVKDYIRPEKN